MRTRHRIAPWLALLWLGLTAGLAYAAVIVIDGSFADWTGSPAVVDGLPDDESTPARADITEFRAEADAGGLYIVKAWDDTQINPGSTAAVTVRAAGGTYLRVYSTASGNPASVDIATLDIKSCGVDPTCSSQTDVCAGTGCTGAQFGSSATWTDPFAGRPAPGCSGTNCGNVDTAVEMYIPWSLLGGAPGDGEFAFLQYGSFPSGPGNAPKDDTGANGISCRNESGTFNCYVSTPTAVTLSAMSAGGLTDPRLQALMALVGLIITCALVWRYGAPRRSP